MKIESCLLPSYRWIECAIPDPHTGLRCISNPNPRGDRVIVKGMDQEGDEIVADVTIEEIEVRPMHRDFRDRDVHYRGVGTVNGICARATVFFSRSHLVAWFPTKESRA